MSTKQSILYSLFKIPLSQISEVVVNNLYYLYTQCELFAYTAFNLVVGFEGSEVQLKLAWANKGYLMTL